MINPDHLWKNQAISRSAMTTYAETPALFEVVEL
jgi:hypothetical protein